MGLIRQISLSLQMSENDIARIIQSAPMRYKVYAIPKKDGIGTRIIAQPAREVKSIQRFIVSEILHELPIHRFAMAYVEGKSIRNNAALHMKNRVIMKLDFKDFFHSLVYKDLDRTLRDARFDTILPSEWRHLENILFWYNKWAGRKCLSIGAPSSPFISNIIMERMDRLFHEICRESSVVYTRYADDITLSGDEIESMIGVEREIRRIVTRTTRPTLEFNEAKRGIFTSAGRRLVTGLVITPDGKVSLGRARKREISAAIHYIITGRNTSLKHINNTKGWLAYAKSVDPEFYNSMVRKYGRTVTQMMRTPTPNRVEMAERA
jgi:RNA-directed DNA polymerase